jgi:ferredoxin/coenzyme F420-reducing hydrogenase delta subunit
VVAHYLETGHLLKLPQVNTETIGELPESTAAKARKAERKEVDLLLPEDRIKDFTPIERGYTESEALCESRRCLACATGAYVESPALCAGCLTCVRICPYGVATVERTAVMPAQKCLTCGLCASECPAAAVALARFATNKMKEKLAEILGRTDSGKISKPFVVSYCCLNETTSRLYLLEQTTEEIEETGVLRVMVPCVGRLGALDLMSPFELGADRVVVIACKEDGCLYTGAEELLQRRGEYGRTILDAIKVGGGSLQFYRTTSSAEESWPEIWQEAKKDMEKTIAG